MSSPPPSRPPSPSPRKGSHEKRQLGAPGSRSLGPLLLWSQSSSCPCTTGKGRALAVQQAPVPAPTPGRCPLWGTCTPHTPCRIAEKPSCNTAWSRAQLRPPRGTYRACFAPLLALAVRSNPVWPQEPRALAPRGTAGARSPSQHRASTQRMAFSHLPAKLCTGICSSAVRNTLPAAASALALAPVPSL